jgi:hypothetical protein
VHEHRYHRREQWQWPDRDYSAFGFLWDLIYAVPGVELLSALEVDSAMAQAIPYLDSVFEFLRHPSLNNKPERVYIDLPYTQLGVAFVH